MVDGVFKEIVKSYEPLLLPDARGLLYPLFPSGYPEHQWEGKYGLKVGDIFVEAGAFWGRYGLVASKRVGPTGRVILIEGNPGNADMIRRVIDNYGMENTELVEGIVWSETERTDFCIEGNPAGSRKAMEGDTKVVNVQAWKLDDLLPHLNVDNVDLLCCDIEGAEVEMVKGTGKYFSQKKIYNVAIGAYHTLTASKEIVAILKGYGYKDVYYSGSIPQYGGIVYGHK